MAIIAKIKLAPLVPNWRDLDNNIHLNDSNKEFLVDDTMDLANIRKGLSKGCIVITEGSLPEIIKEGDGNTTIITGITKEEVDRAINNAVSKITHPITSIEKQDILDRLTALENAQVNQPTSPDDTQQPNDDPQQPTTNETYAWKEVYVMTSSSDQIDITGSKIITDCEANGQIFWDNFDSGIYKLYAPRLVMKNGVHTTEEDDLEETLVPITGYGEEQGTDLPNVSPSLNGITWSWDEGQTYIQLNSTPSTLVVFYLIKTN